MIKSQRTETIVRQRYAIGAKERADKLCCPVEYDSEYLKVIPQEVIERDYGCGDPSRYLREGEVVLDPGSGTGKICFIAALHLNDHGYDPLEKAVRAGACDDRRQRGNCEARKSFQALQFPRDR